MNELLLPMNVGTVKLAGSAGCSCNGDRRVGRDVCSKIDPGARCWICNGLQLILSAPVAISAPRAVVTVPHGCCQLMAIVPVKPKLGYSRTLSVKYFCCQIGRLLSSCGHVGIPLKNQSNRTLALITVLACCLTVFLVVSLAMSRAQAQSEIATPWGTLTEVASMPTNGTFYSIENVFPPSPFDPFPDLPLYTDGEGNFYYSNPDGHHWSGRHGSHGGRVTPDYSPPDPGGLGGSGSTGFGVTNPPLPNFTITSNYNDYTNFFLSITNDTTNAYVSVMNTLPGFGYTVLTNYDLTTTNWGVFYTFTATNYITPCPAVAMDTNSLFFNAKLNLGGGSLWVCSNVAPTQLVSWLMGTNPVIVTNVTYTGCSLAVGIFINAAMVGVSSGYPGLAFDRGIILSTGWITNALGPNNNSGSNGWDGSDIETTSLSDLFPFCGENTDSDLSALAGGNHIHDAAVLEFDIIASNSFQLSFDYIFASEEYPEWIGQFNDTFAIFVSTNYVYVGPPGYGSWQWQNSIANDIALVPGTNLPIAVNTIHGGCTDDLNIPGPTNATNPQFYIDNCDPYYNAASPYAAPSSVYNLQYDGFTAALTAQTNICVGVTNHIKIAIGDCNDYLYDSSVFIKASIPIGTACTYP
jgi:hypothetical protein